MASDHQIPSPIEALSFLSGVPEEDVAIQLACLFTALGGPHAGLMTLGDEFQAVGFHHVHVGGESARQRRLIELLFRPLRFLQEDLSSYSHLAPAKQLDWMARAYVEGKCRDEYLPFNPSEETMEGAARNDVYHLSDLSSQAVSLSSPWGRKEDVARHMDEIGCKTGLPVDTVFRYLPGHSMLSQTYVGRNEGRCLYEPVIFLDNPGFDRFRRPWEGMDRGSPLILDESGRLWAESLESKGGKKALASLLEERVFDDPTAHGKDRYRSGSARLFSLVPESLGRGIMSDPALKHLRCTSLLGRTSEARSARDPELEAEQVATGYESYRRAMKEIVRLRRLDASGLWWTRMKPQVAMDLHLRQREFVENLESVDPGERIHTAGLAHLPVSLVWTLAQLKGNQEITSDQVSLAITWAEKAMRSHLDTMRELARNADMDRIERKAAEMLRKLLEVEPCTIRDLLRKYPVQRRELHEPVLNHLVETGKILRLENNRIRLTDDARVELASPVPVPA